MTAQRRIVAIAFAVVLALAFANALRGWNLRTDFNEFRAAYCGARGLSAGADPNLVEPLRRCERALDGGGDFQAAAMLVPADAPSYVLLAFEPLAQLPYPLAAALFALLLLSCTFATIVLLARVMHLPLLYVGLALGPTEGLAGLMRGSLVPVTLLCVA